MVSKTGLLNPTKTVCECGLVLEKRSLSRHIKKDKCPINKSCNNVRQKIQEIMNSKREDI